MSRAETQLAADTVYLLLVSGVIDRRRWNAHQLAVTVGCSMEELEDSRSRCQTKGVDSLRADPDAVCGQTDIANVDTGNTNRESRRRAAPSHPGERQCSRCGDWWPTEEFDRATSGDPRPLDGYRRKMCPACFGEFERGHFIAVRDADALHQVVAFLTTAPPDASVGQKCPNCERSIEDGDPIKIQGVAMHVKCGGRR